MAYFRQLEDKLQNLLKLFNKDERWLVLVNADPDALASAMALRRIAARRVRQMDIAQINEIQRPDNLTMIKCLRIPTRRYTPELATSYDRFALVDSQPSHNPQFQEIAFDVVLDHHPLKPEAPVQAAYVEIRPEYGANATLLTEYLYNLKIKPSPRLATALLYGIKSDTSDFVREFCDTDVKAFRYLSKYANQMMLKKIVRSEFRKDWLAYFSQGIERLHYVGRDGGGAMVHMGRVENPDILVILADFFLRVHEVSWDAVSGLSDHTLVVILRGDGIKLDMGKVAARAFGDVGSAGGHPAAARAEVPLDALQGADPEQFVLDRMCRAGGATCTPPEGFAPDPDAAEPDAETDAETESDADAETTVSVTEP